MKEEGGVMVRTWRIEELATTLERDGSVVVLDEDMALLVLSHALKGKKDGDGFFLHIESNSYRITTFKPEQTFQPRYGPKKAQF